MIARPRRFLTALSLLAAAVSLAGCNRGDEDLSNVAVIGDLPSLSDAVGGPMSTGDALLRSNVAQGLVRFDARGQVVPGLAERWNVSDDGLSYIFRLQTGEWPDGRKIKAQDVARILSRQLRSANANPLRETLGAVTSVVAMTDRVIEIQLAAPRPNLLQLLAQPEFGLVREGVGSGPFRLSKKDAEAKVDETAEIQSLLIQHRIVIPDAEDIREEVRMTAGPAHALIQQFKDDKLDVVLGGSFDDLPLAAGADLPRGTLRFDPAAGLFGLAATKRSDALADREVRRLVSQAIDRQAIVAQLKVANLQPRATILQPGLEGLGDIPQPEWLRASAADRRAQLVAEANRLFGKVERPTLRIDLPQGQGGEIVISEIARDLEPLGIKVGRAATRASADLIWIDEVAPSTSPAWFLRRFACGGPTICLEEVEPILDQARHTMVARDRAALLYAAAIKMDEEQLFIPIAAPVRWSLVRSGIDGFVENQFARHTLVGLKNRRARED